MSTARGFGEIARNLCKRVIPVRSFNGGLELRCVSLRHSYRLPALKKQQGFWFIELLMVVTIILIIAATAIPNLLRDRMAANESACAGTLRTINTSRNSLVTAYPASGYADTLAKLGAGDDSAHPSSSDACLIDNTLAAASDAAHAKSGLLHFGRGGFYSIR